MLGTVKRIRIVKRVLVRNAIAIRSRLYIRRRITRLLILSFVLYIILRERKFIMSL